MDISESPIECSKESPFRVQAAVLQQDIFSLYFYLFHLSKLLEIKINMDKGLGFYLSHIAIIKHTRNKWV